MIRILFVLILLGSLSVFASSLDYEKEAAVAAKEARRAYYKGDTKTLAFALERLTVSCNMIALDGEELTKPCVVWFDILKKGCPGSQEKALLACARKFYIKLSKRPIPLNRYGSKAT